MDKEDVILFAIIALVVLMAFGGCQLSMQIHSVSAQGMPPLYVDHFMPYIVK